MASINTWLFGHDTVSNVELVYTVYVQLVYTVRNVEETAFNQRALWTILPSLSTTRNERLLHPLSPLIRCDAVSFCGSSDLTAQHAVPSLTNYPFYRKYIHNPRLSYFLLFASSSFSRNLFSHVKSKTIFHLARNLLSQLFSFFHKVSGLQNLVTNYLKKFLNHRYICYFFTIYLNIVYIYIINFISEALSFL